MADVEVTSQAEAKAHIAKIRHDKGLLDGKPSGPNVSDLEHALTTLSDQLYQSSTHFLLEIIQNADDNAYTDEFTEVFSLHIIRRASLRGTSRRCVELGRVPRKERRKSMDMLGRKESDSNLYSKLQMWFGCPRETTRECDHCAVQCLLTGTSFKFDRSQPLGMIAPIWEDFPAPVKSGITSMYLKLSDDYYAPRLLRELRALDSRLLIFLRRLRSISVTIAESFTNFKSSFSRTDVKNDHIRLTENDMHCDYIIKRHRVLGMPEEKRREGISSSEIVLGFPVNTDGKNYEPRRESQQVYAFLPIHDYGFESALPEMDMAGFEWPTGASPLTIKQFLIQADFLLIASREDIDSSSQWNVTLRKNLTSAFIDAMKEFNNGQLRYLWPRWLPTRAPLQSFLKPFHEDLVEELKTSPLLYSHSEELVAGKQLSYVPDEYIFEGAPLTISSSTSPRYLSGRYLNEYMKYLEVVGVGRITEATFYLELTAMLQSSAGEFRRKCDAWQSHLAGILTRMSPGFHFRLPGLAIVPLSDGTWTNAQGQFILFPAFKNQFAVPGGLDLRVVDSNAAADPRRRNLFKLMGIGELEKAPVLQHVEDLHRFASVSRGHISSQALISQIEFLYAEQYQNPNCHRFWFTTESGKRLHGSQLYQHSTRPHSATGYFANSKGKFQFLHKDYLAFGGQGINAWYSWLEDKMQVATIPRLVELTTDRGFKLSEDFDKFFDPDQERKWSQDPSMKVYDTSEYLRSVTKLRQKLGAMLVQCEDGQSRRLDKTYLPCRELRVASHKLPFLEVPDPDDHAWKSFEILEELSQSKFDNAPELFAKLIDTIQYRCFDDVEVTAVKKFFESADRVCIPAADGSSHEWVHITECRWKGPQLPAVRIQPSEKGTDIKIPQSSSYSPTYRHFRPVGELYPGNKQLFWQVLGVRNSNLRDLIDEATQFRAGDSLMHVSAIFKAISKLMEADESKCFQVYAKRDLEKVFPVSKNWKNDTDVVTEIKSMNESCEWFIADTAVDDLISMTTLLEELGLTSRSLRGQAKSVAKTNGNVQFNEQLTELFRTKVDFLIRLIPTAKQHRAKHKEVIKQLRNLEVYIVDEVVQHCCVWYKKKWVYGPASSGQVALAGDSDSLKIYFTPKAGADPNQMPIELADEVFNFCGMQQDQPLHSEHDHARLARTFSSKGIPNLESLEFANAEDVSRDESDPDETKTVGSKMKSGWKGWQGKIVEAERSPPTLTIASAGMKKPKRKFRIFGTDLSTSKAAGITVAAIVFSPILIPAGIVYGVSQAIQDKILFDRNNDGGHAGYTADTAKEAKQRADMNSKASKPERFIDGEAGPGGMERFNKSVSEGVLRLQRVVFASACNEDVAYRGELAVHEALSETLGQSYNATQHWTSKRRLRAGLPEFSSIGPDTQSTFRFSDSGGSFTQLLAQADYPEARNWTTRPPRYHIDVKSSTGDLRADFLVTPAEFQRARKFSVMVQQMKGDDDDIPTDVYILVRVYDIDVKSKQAKSPKGKAKACKTVFLVDPWEYYHADRLLLKHGGDLVGSVI
ncbi:uncharacterized protein RAG0_01389 [Rhynchosporium agropyri]|uniref:Protein NO VEIN C-terminal domain-containing protein n=1 Tax=Rhynchosporium agropyri TaxID=914238 RepID=A0A1E1JX80_9HELO|nr:uncharacterized protein RAG0_01389 [Rhynchosporium agropyri]